MVERQQLEQAIIAQESLRGTVDDTIVEATISALRKQLAELENSSQDERRKQVTVLFADLAGFTALSEGLDPEEVREIQGAYFSAVTPAIEIYGGAVEKYIGDAVLAVFGLPQARENDPVSAVRAALEMQGALRELNNSINSQWGFKIAMRIGVNTGIVLATVRGEGDDFLVTGDPVNLASRLESAAPPGGVLISHSTYRHIQRLFEVEILEPIAVKGKVEPIQVYLVGGVKPEQFRPVSRGVEGVQTNIVGRQSEMKFLEDVLSTAFQGKRGQLITIVGDAGVGKSRLLYEFEKKVERNSAGVNIFRGRATRETRNRPFGLVRNLFATLCHIQDSDPVDAVCRKLETRLQDIFGDDAESLMKSHAIGHVLGYDFCSSSYLVDMMNDPQQVYHRARLYMGEFLRHSARHSPTMILLEDIHWSDESSLDLVQHLAGEIVDEPFLFVCLARPSLHERYPQWDQGQGDHRRLDLASLTTSDCQSLVEALLTNVERIPQELLDLIVLYADGNPFYVEELIKMMIEEGVIQASAEPWLVDTSLLVELHVPPTLTGVLQARLEQLPGAEQTVMQRASVVGRTFWDQAILHVTEATKKLDNESNILQALETLRRREMVFNREPSRIAGADEYFFKHALLREVTYESVLKRLRRLYHGLVADWLVDQRGDRSVEISGLIAEHLELSGRNSEAIHYFAQAASQAAARYANTEAIKYFQRAIDLLEDIFAESGHDEAIATFYEEMGDVFGLLHQKSEAQFSYQQALAIVPDRERIWRARLQRKTGNYYQDYKTRRNAYDLAEGALGATPPNSEKKWWQEWISIYIERIWISYIFGQVDDFDELRERTQPVVEAYGTPEQHIRYLGALGSHDNLKNRFVVTEEAIAYSREALEWTRPTGNLREIATRQFSLGFNLLFAGQLQEAEDYLLSALELGKKVGDAWIQTASLNYLAIVNRLLGKPEKVREYAGGTLLMADAAKLNVYTGMAKANLGWLAWLIGDHDHAEVVCKEALEILSATTNPFNWSVLFPLIQIASSRGELDKAVDYLAQVMKPKQMRLPDDLSVSAEGSIAAWENGQEAEVFAFLHRTLGLAKDFGYL